jgi:hypothetical protein
VKVDLTNGNSAELYDNLDHISNDERDALSYVLEDGEGTPLRRTKAFHRLIIQHSVKSWTLTEPIPSVDPSVLGRISGGDGRLLENVAASKMHFSEPVQADEAEPGSRPTSPSSPSSSRLRAAN